MDGKSYVTLPADVVMSLAKKCFTWVNHVRDSEYLRIAQEIHERKKKSLWRKVLFIKTPPLEKILSDVKSQTNDWHNERFKIQFLFSENLEVAKMLINAAKFQSDVNVTISDLYAIAPHYEPKKLSPYRGQLPSEVQAYVEFHQEEPSSTHTLSPGPG